MFKKKIYDPKSSNPFPIGRTKIDLFFDCKRCFYFDLRYGVKRPHGTPLVINNKIVEQFKKEFDFFRQKKTSHPEILNLKRNLIPAQFSEIINWKNPFKGVRYIEKKKNLIFFGSIDDIWLDTENNNYICVIFKSTSKNEPLQPTNIWEGYWKQLSYYSYLLQKNNIKISRNGLIFYINTKQSLSGQSKIDFEFHLFEKILDFSWIEECFSNIYDILNSNIIPEFTSNCKFCNYVKNINSQQNEKS